MPFIVTTTHPPEHDGATILDAAWPQDIGGHNARQSANGQVDNLMVSGRRGVRLPGGVRIEVEPTTTSSPACPSLGEAHGQPFVPPAVHPVLSRASRSPAGARDNRPIPPLNVAIRALTLMVVAANEHRARRLGL